MKTYFVVGGAGFIGSHLVKLLTKEEPEANIVVYDNFSSGRLWHLEQIETTNKIEIIKADVQQLDTLKEAMKGADIVYHFASNPDIARAVVEPDIDFWQGSCLTNNVLEAMRVNGIKKILYASGSGVYGDTGTVMVDESYWPCHPISTYGASKLGCEALICSYCFMFDMQGFAFRFGNVVGPHQTHGVGYYFIKRLKQNPSRLKILGDGSQSKPYIDVNDVISAMRLIEKGSKASGLEAFNVATEDYITVRQIAEIAVEIMGLKDTEFVFGDNNRGWKGDVPIVRLKTEKIKKLGWNCCYNSREAMVKSITSIYADAMGGKFAW